jgi:predicted TPR repeat methyltransferase
VLDFGCGTGLSGEALAAARVSRCIDGADVSAEMLEGARDKGVYRQLLKLDPEAPLPGRPGAYAAVTAAG